MNQPIFEDRELPGVFAVGKQVRILSGDLEGRTGVVMESWCGGVRTTSGGNIVISVDGLYSVDYPPEDLEVL